MNKQSKLFKELGKLKEGKINVAWVEKEGEEMDKCGKVMEEVGKVRIPLIKGKKGGNVTGSVEYEEFMKQLEEGKEKGERNAG